jgi:hypothetical protein
MTHFRHLTKAQQRQLVTGMAAASTPLSVRMRNGETYDLVLLGVAQEERAESDPYSQRGSLVMARFYYTTNYLVLRMADIASWEQLRLSAGDPNSPDYRPEAQVVRPIPPEAMAARKRGGENRHSQRGVPLSEWDGENHRSET